MVITTQKKNDYETNPLGFRKITHYSHDYNCLNCYEHSYPCENCKFDPDYEVKHYYMSYKEFVKVAIPGGFINGKFPETYKEYCELYELYMYGLIDDSNSYPEGCGPDCPDDCFNPWDMEFKLKMSLENIIKHDDPTYTLKGDQEVDGDDMGECSSSYMWGERSDEEKKEYLDWEINEYFSRR
jgi:hypothetical protein